MDRRERLRTGILETTDDGSPHVRPPDPEHVSRRRPARQPLFDRSEEGDSPRRQAREIHVGRSVVDDSDHLEGRACRDHRLQDVEALPPEAGRAHHDHPLRRRHHAPAVPESP